MTETITGLEAALRSAGVSVESLARDDRVELAYLTAFPGERVHHREMGRALNAFIDRAEAEEWEPTPVDATVLRTEGDVLGTWRAEPEWFEALTAGEITETEFSTRVLDTLDEDADGTDADATGDDR